MPNQSQQKGECTLGDRWNRMPINDPDKLGGVYFLVTHQLLGNRRHEVKTDFKSIHQTLAECVKEAGEIVVRRQQYTGCSVYWYNPIAGVRHVYTSSPVRPNDVSFAAICAADPETILLNALPALIDAFREMMDKPNSDSPDFTTN